MILRTTILLILNFTALAFGGLFTSEGVPSEWYLSLLKAPWTPPGWVFGFAWSIIMISYAFYMGFLYNTNYKKTTIIISHRISTLERSDNIIVIKEGEIIEEGTHHELINNDGFYSQIHVNQTDNK